MVFVILIIVCLLVITLTAKIWKLDHQLVQHNQLSSEVFSNFKNFCFNIIIILLFIFSLLKCQHFVAKQLVRIQFLT